MVLCWCKNLYLLSMGSNFSTQFASFVLRHPLICKSLNHIKTPYASVASFDKRVTSKVSLCIFNFFYVCTLFHVYVGYSLLLCRLWEIHSITRTQFFTSKVSLDRVVAELPIQSPANKVKTALFRAALALTLRAGLS